MHSDISFREMMATFISRDLEDGQWVEVGANSPIPRAGVLLAHLLRGPNMTVMIAMTKANLTNEPVTEEFEFITDYQAIRWAEAYYPHDQFLNNMKFRQRGVFFCGALQVDKFGNTNLIGVGPDYHQLQFRGPGGIGTCNATVYNGRYHIVVNSHDRRVFVERCDHISAVGWGEGGEDARSNLGLPPGGPKYVVTPLCIMDFEEGTKRMRLRSVHRGVTVEQVVENTGFPLVLPSEVPVTEPPTDEELQVLRTRIDPHGVLRR